MTTTGIDWSTLLKETSFDRAVDPYFVWADMTDFVGYFESAPDKDTNIPFLVESKISPPPKTEFNTATFKLKDVWGSLVNVSATVRWQFGQARTAYFRVETKRFVPDTARVVAAVLDDGCPFFNQTYTETSLP